MADRLSSTSTFSSNGRGMEGDDEIELVSVGVDIGSSTSHLIFSRLKMERDGSRYVVVYRQVLHQSDIIFTPYLDPTTIDSATLEKFIEGAFKQAGFKREAIDTGALILTGTAVLKENARAIADLFAREAGRFVAVSAGDSLETTLAAHGSGAAALSEERGETVMNVDVGGGTSKIAICRDGAVQAVCAIEVGARLIALDETGAVVRFEDAGRRMFKAMGIPLEIGDRPTEEQLQAFVTYMADRLMEVIRVEKLGPAALSLLRTPPLAFDGPIQGITFSGGVSEFIYGREATNFGDLGGMISAEIRKRLESHPVPLLHPVAGIRATVIGASQHTVQLSGNTIFVSSMDAVPVRNLPVVTPRVDLSQTVLDPEAITAALRQALERLDLLPLERPVAVAFHWDGSASFRRLHALCAGVANGLPEVVAAGQPLVLVTDGDVGGLIGLHLKEELSLTTPIISIDGVELREFDFIDVGSLVPESGALPVIIKSLVFPSSKK